MPSFIDTNGVGQPKTFDPRREDADFKVWYGHLLRWVNSTFAGAKEEVVWPTTQKTPVTLYDTAGALPSVSSADWQQWASQIDTALSSLLENEACDLGGSTEGHAFEGSRLLVHWCDPASQKRSNRELC